MIKETELDEYQKQFLAAKRKEFEVVHSDSSTLDDNGSFPAKATLCAKCSVKSVVLMDGCTTCLNCGDSKCT
jgi:hypothetical protein